MKTTVVENTNTHTFVVQLTLSRKVSGKKALQIIVEPTSGPAYLRTFDSGEWTDNPLA